MGDYPGIYKGANYGFDKEETFEPLIPSRYRINPGQFGLTTDPRTANQLKEVSDKFNTGAKTVEVSGISTEVLESIPDQHLREIARLKKLAGADITFHGPLVEPTGFDQRSGTWEESSRMQAERQIWDAVKRGQQMMITNVSDFEKTKKAKYADENLVITLHSNNGLINTGTRVKNKEGKDEFTSIAVIDEYSGKAGMIPIEEDTFEGRVGNKKPTADEEIDRINRKLWLSSLHNISTEARNGKRYIEAGLSAGPKKISGKLDKEELDDVDDLMQSQELDSMKEVYKIFKDDRTSYENLLKNPETIFKEIGKRQIEHRVDLIANGERTTRDSYDQMKEMYNKAKDALTRDSRPEAKSALKQLEEYRLEVAPKISEYVKDSSKIQEFTDDVAKGIRILSTLPVTPPQYRKVEDFAVEQASKTFAGVAAKAYKEFGESAPILSIENPPAGTSGLTRADELKKLVEASRSKLASELEFDQGLNRKDAQKAAEKLIGVTWDVGHINMIKKFGYDDKDLVKETEIIKPYLKHVHLSDNFGLEHTELPMGMGNVPMKEHLEAIGEKIKGMKAIVETGGHWYNDFKTSPLPESLAAFGSPIYPMQMQGTWDRGQAQVGSYFSGYGFNPEVHHSIYGAGFAGLPTELGGSAPGRNRLSGTPMD